MEQRSVRVDVQNAALSLCYHRQIDCYDQDELQNSTLISSL